MDLKERKKLTSISRHPWELARLEVISKLVAPFLKNSNNEDMNILDIGCGDLFFVDSYSKIVKAKYHAIDNAFTNEEIEALMKEHKDKDIFVNNNLEKLKLSGSGKAKIIFMMDVIEHIQEDKKFLTELLEKEFVSKDTILVITVPAFQSLFTSHDRFLGHYRRYTNRSLRIWLQWQIVKYCKLVISFSVCCSSGLLQKYLITRTRN
jgi:2-polyprenyl-3-methyl-5-hydroxy-6-metoxy-1,4-benzoquinol methylase